MRRPELTGGQIARRVGCTRQNVHQVLHLFLDGDREQELRDFQAKQADIYDFLQQRILASITEEKIKKSSARALTLVPRSCKTKRSSCANRPRASMPQHFGRWRRRYAADAECRGLGRRRAPASESRLNLFPLLVGTDRTSPLVPSQG